MFGGLKNKIVKALAIRWARGKVEALRGKDKETAMGKAWKFFEGWRLLIAVAGLFSLNVYDAYHNGHSGQFLASVLVALGWLPPGEWTGEAMSKAVLGAVGLFGFAAKVWRAQMQRRAGSSVTGLLSDEGYVAAAVVAAIKSPAVNEKMTTVVDKATVIGEAKVEAKS